VPDVAADAVVIGAGVIGASIALELACSGRDVVVVDRGSGAGTGSTAASSACVRFHYSTWEGVATSWEAKHGWERWEQHLGDADPVGMARYVKTGVLVFEFPGFDSQRVLELYREIGIPFEELDGAGITQRFPYLSAGRHFPPRRIDDDRFWDPPAGELRAFYTPDGGFVDDPQLAAQNLMHAAERHGARAIYNAQVIDVRRDNDRVAGVRLADGRLIRAGVVVNAAGPHSGRINQLAGVRDFNITTRPLRQEVHHLKAPTGFDVAAPAPMVGDGDLGIYFRPQPGGALLLGGQEPDCDELEWLADPDDYAPTPTVSVFEAQTTRAARRLPDLAVPPRPTGIVGVYDVTDDWIPIYDRTDLPGYYVAIGTSGNQFKNAPVVGKLMTTLIDACESGHDHDAEPVVWTTPTTQLQVNLGHYSRLRAVNPESSNSVLG
jgi:sarcosine oxidase subunit beta